MPYISRCSDGLYHFDYFKELLLGAVQPGDGYAERLKEWLEDVTKLIAKNLAELESKGKLKELAKWTWFAREFRNGLESLDPKILEVFGISLDKISWSKPTGF